jgi:Ser/Thr protein kinase RdoA (MazF antagonist)
MPQTAPLSNGSAPRLPELLPDKPACLTHGDLWAQNIMATADGRPALIDPAVSYTWAEVDLAHVFTTVPPPEADAFFESLHAAHVARLRLEEADADPPAAPAPGGSSPSLNPDWGAADLVRATLAPFRRHD